MVAGRPVECFQLSGHRISTWKPATTSHEWTPKVELQQKGVNECLGEVYLEINHFDKAMRQLEILDDLYGQRRMEYSKRKAAIDPCQEASAINS